MQKRIKKDKLLFNEFAYNVYKDGKKTEFTFNNFHDATIKAKEIKGKVKSENNSTMYLEFAESTGLPYAITESNYQMEITSSFLNIKFLQEERPPFVFAIGKMIEKDIRDTGLVQPEFKKSDIVYFDFTDNKNFRNAPETIYNVDIKSAYAHVLFNHGLIKPKTFKYMSKLSKKDRLTVVGMLAATKNIYMMEGREIVGYDKTVKDTKNWFLFCVYQTNKLMQECAQIIGASFLFYWVDGIFFTDKNKASAVQEFLNSKGYRSTFEECTKFKFVESKKNCKLIYLKGSNGEKKELSLPKKNNEVNEFLINFLTLND